MSSRSTSVAYGLALPGFIVFVLVALPIAAFGAFKAVDAVGAWWNAGPNYAIAPTSACLRQHGYTVERFKAEGVPVVRASRGSDWLDGYFTRSPQAAGALAPQMYSAITRRNVVFDTDVALPRDRPIVACLRSP